MGMREDIMAVKQEIQEMKQESLAMELLKDQRKQNKRLFIIILVILTFWFATIGYLVYLLNDIGTVETTYEQEVTDVETIGGSVINKGDIYGEDKTNN